MELIAWNPDHFGETPRKLEKNGQGVLFFDDSLEPPDPDDFPTLAAYKKALHLWEQQHGNLFP